MEIFLLFMANNFTLIWIVVCIVPIFISFFISFKHKKQKKELEKIKLDKKEIILSKSIHIVTINISIIFLLVGINLIIFGIWFVLEGENIIGPIMGCLFAVVFIFMTIVKIKYITSIISDIKHDRYKIKEDEVVSINGNLNFRNTNEFMTFKLKNYKKILYADREEFNNTKVGDLFYLVFVKSEKEPIKFYSKKNVLIDKAYDYYKNK